MPQEHTRRRVLRTGGQLAAAGAVASSAGCLSSIPFIGGGPIPPKKWTAAPDVFVDAEYGNFNYMQPKTLLKDDDELSDSFVDRLESDSWRTEATGIDPESVAAELSLGPYRVVKAKYKKNDVTDELEDNDFEDEGKTGGFTVYVAADDSEYAGRAVGVTGGKLVFGRATGDNDAQDVVETAVDVGKGNEDRFVDESDAAKTLMNKLGTTEVVRGGTQEAPDETNEEQGQFEDNVGTGIATTVNGSTTKLKVFYVFEDKSAADKGAVEDWVDELEDSDEGTIADANSVNVNKNGRAVVIKVKIDTDEYFE